MTIVKPQPKFGWSSEVALEHQNDLAARQRALEWDLDRAMQYTDKKFVDYAPDLEWDRIAGLLTDEIYERPPTVTKKNDTGDYRQLATFTPKPSEWVQYALLALEETGARRALPWDQPGCTVKQNDHYTYSTKYADTVLVGSPVS